VASEARAQTPRGLLMMGANAVKAPLAAVTEANFSRFWPMKEAVPLKWPPQ